MSRFSSGAESEEEAFSVQTGETPTLTEIRDHFSVLQYYTAESGTDSNSSGELSESFAELLEKKREEQRNEAKMSGSVRSSKYPTRRILSMENTNEELPSSQEEGKSMWNADDSFLAAEKVCEKTLEYNTYMNKIQGIQSPKNIYSEDEETILNDVEPPSMLCEQTILRGTPGKNPFANRPSTILEESTLATSECSFYTAELTKKESTGDSMDNTEDTEDNTDETLSEKVEVIELSDSGASGEEQAEQSEFSDNSRETESLPSSSQSAPTDDSSLNMSREFNDSLEKVEYLMMKGEKYRKKMGMEPIAINTPTSASSSSSGAIPKSNIFKQPRMPPSKIPQMRPKKYDHIKSPISAYIHKTPKNPLFTANRIGGQVPAKTPGANSSPRLRVLGEKENQEAKLSPRGMTLPKKACVQAAYASVHDERVTPIAAGPKMMKLIGDSVDPEKTPGVTRHMCRYKTVRLPPDIVELERKKMSLTEDSIADLSLMSGDVSVQVVKNAINF